MNESTDCEKEKNKQQNKGMDKSDDKQIETSHFCNEFKSLNQKQAIDKKKNMKIACSIESQALY